MGQVPDQVSCLAMDAVTIPSREIDGDFYDFYQPTQALCDVVIGDVMGKGLPAALVGTAVKAQLIRFANPSSHNQRECFRFQDLFAPAEILSQVHHAITSQLINLEFFVSLFYGRFDLDQQMFSFVDCGFTKPIHYQMSKDKISFLEGKNFPLGMVETATYQTVTTPFELDDLFIFYSDGVSETRAPSGELYGLERLQRLVQANKNATPQVLLRTIKEDLLSFSENDQLDDDLTLIVIKVVGSEKNGIILKKDATFTSDLSQLSAVRHFVDRLCLQAPGDSSLLSSQLQLAINEVFCNIVKHSYQALPGGSIVIEGELSQEGVLFEIRDQGNSFDPRELEEPSLAGDRDHGFGWYMIREISDQIIYTPKESAKDWNQLRIFKRYHLEEAAMEFSHHSKNHVLVVNVNGKNLDAKHAPHFKEEVIRLISDEDKTCVVFDLNCLQFIDSSGLGSLLSILRELNARGGDLKLANMTTPIRQMFEIVRMHKLFEIFNHSDDAVHSFRK